MRREEIHPNDCPVLAAKQRGSTMGWVTADLQVLVLTHAHGREWWRARVSHLRVPVVAGARVLDGALLRLAEV